jgi:hypothetical protein
VVTQLTATGSKQHSFYFGFLLDYLRLVNGRDQPMSCEIMGLLGNVGGKWSYVRDRADISLFACGRCKP